MSWNNVIPWEALPQNSEARCGKESPSSKDRHAPAERRELITLANLELAEEIIIMKEDDGKPKDNA